MMKTSIKLFCCMFFLPLALFAQSILGDWHGVLDLKVMKLNLVFHITGDKGTLSGTMDSPDQNAKGIPLTFVTFVKDTLKFGNSDMQMTYVASFKGDSLIGMFHQMGQKTPLSLFRQAKLQDNSRRPQTPIAPFPYQTKEVSFKQRSGTFNLAGTLTIPSNKKEYPIAVMATGSGQQDRDESLFGHKPFWVIADYFARQGIATLRIDDRGVGQSGGDVSTATTFDFAEDIQSAIDFLSEQTDICTNNIGVVGHSEGALIGTVIAGTAYSEKNPVKFLVMMAGSSVTGDQVVMAQSEAIGRRLDSNYDVSTNKMIYQQLFGVIKDPNLTYDQVSNLGRKVVDSLSISDEQKQGVYPLFAPWFIEFVRLNPTIYMERATCPILALFGSNDLQVLPKQNIPPLKAVAKKSKAKMKIKEYKGLNHLFQHSKTGLPTEYSDIEETISEEVLKDMAKWILNVK